MFVDHIDKLEVVAGKGGDGIVSWVRAKYIPKGGPGGGNGGKGGNVVFVASENISSLESFLYTKLIKAEDGAPGGKNKCTGAFGHDHIVNVPVGSIIKDLLTDCVIADLNYNGKFHVLCSGGEGGKGNAFFANSSNRVPFVCTEGKPGESKSISIELRHIAEFGFVGLPNAGKSSLLSAVTGSQPKIGPYPFTTIYPNLGTIKRFDGKTFTFADIPGLVHGASKGKGLGIDFLRHVFRCRSLIFVIDIQDSDHKPIDAFLLLKEEIESFDRDMMKKEVIIVLNKIDLVLLSNDEIERLKNQFESCSVFFTSSYSGDGIDMLVNKLIS